MWCGSVAAINTSQLPILLSLQKHKIPTIFTYHIHVSTVGIFFPDGLPRGRWQDDIESSQWLELLHPFTAVKGLYASREIAPRIAPAIQELVGERVMEVLPALRGIFLEEPFPSGPVQETIGQFVAARQLAGHPIAVSLWERK